MLTFYLVVSKMSPRAKTSWLQTWEAGTSFEEKQSAQMDKGMTCDEISKKKKCSLFKRSVKVIQRQNRWVTSCILKTCGRAPWLALLQTPRRSWSLLLRLPAPGCGAHRWSFRLGCRPQRAAELDASQNHTTLSQRPDGRYQIVTNMKRESRGRK